MDARRRSDATFIILHCCKAGIGFRHWETQRFTALPLRFTRSFDNRKYGGFQIGLHLTIVKDVLECEAPHWLGKPLAEPITAGKPSDRGHWFKPICRFGVGLVSPVLYLISLRASCDVVLGTTPHLPWSRVISWLILVLSFFRVESSWTPSLAGGPRKGRWGTHQCKDLARDNGSPATLVLRYVSTEIGC